MKFRYLQGATSQYGYDFAEGEFTEVTDKFAIRKLSQNSFFESGYSDAQAPEIPSHVPQVDAPVQAEEKPSFAGTIFKRKPGRPPKS